MPNRCSAQIDLTSELRDASLTLPKRGIPAKLASAAAGLNLCRRTGRLAGGEPTANHRFGFGMLRARRGRGRVPCGNRATSLWFLFSQPHCRPLPMREAVEAVTAVAAMGAGVMVAAEGFTAEGFMVDTVSMREPRAAVHAISGE